jgi:hypothetical protein
MLDASAFVAVAPFFRLDLASAGTALAAGVALVYAQRQVSDAKDRGKQELAYRLSERAAAPDFVPCIAAASDFLTIEEQGSRRCREEERRWQRWQRMPRLEKGKIVVYLNHLEHVGGLHAKGRLDKEAAMLLFGQAASAYWERGQWFIGRLREEQPRAFSEWEKLNDAYLQYRKDQGD